jgi:hypothetical protein
MAAAAVMVLFGPVRFYHHWTICLATVGIYTKKSYLKQSVMPGDLLSDEEVSLKRSLRIR